MSDHSFAVGSTHTFYCTMQQEYEPAAERLRNYTGQTVTITALIPLDDPDGSLSYEVRAEDGRAFTALEDELDGFQLSQGTFFWPDGTFGPNHDTTYLVNERG